MSDATDIPGLGEMQRLRRRLHAAPELAGAEVETAAAVAEFVARFRPTALHTEVGGHGLLAVFAAARAAPDGRDGEPTVVLRAELDGLPITEEGSDRSHRSRHQGRAHACGHDGHMTMVAGLASRLQRLPPERGRIVLLFQPAEETGEGARRVVRDPRWRALAPRWVFALHNLPGYPLGTALLKDGPLAAASVGLAIRLTGRSAHAAHPEQGRSPAAAVARLVPRLATLGTGPESTGELALVTVVHIHVGERAFGTAPGQGEVLATLRAGSDRALAALREAATSAAQEEAARDELALELSWHDAFPATSNHPAAIALASRACRELDIAVATPAESPFHWSEDFGTLSRNAPGALIGLGAGRDHPVLHAPDFDFPDALLPIGVRLLARLAALALAAPRAPSRTD